MVVVRSGEQRCRDGGAGRADAARRPRGDDRLVHALSTTAGRRRPAPARPGRSALGVQAPALGVLEQLGSPAAVRLLERLAQGSARAHLTREAKDALARVNARRGLTPEVPKPRELKGHENGVTAVVFTPDGQTLAAAGKDGSIYFWKVAGGQLRLKLLGHQGGVYTLAFAPDGKVLASGGADQQIRLWNPSTGTEIRCLRGHVGKVAAVAFAPDGRLLASGAYDQTIRLWDPA